MSAVELALLALAGVGAGLAGSIAGLASLVSYPALLAVGLPPVTANVTNTVSLVASGVGSALGSRPELAGQAGRVGRLGLVAAAGGTLGGALLLLTPSEAFERIVPWLIAVAALVILAQPRPAFLRRLHHGGDAPRCWSACSSSPCTAGTSEPRPAWCCSPCSWRPRARRSPAATR